MSSTAYFQYGFKLTLSFIVEVATYVCRFVVKWCNFILLIILFAMAVSIAEKPLISFSIVNLSVYVL